MCDKVLALNVYKLVADEYRRTWQLLLFGLIILAEG